MSQPASGSGHGRCAVCARISKGKSDTRCRYYSSQLLMALAPGTQLGNYEILGLLGSGGMGVVYRAHDRRLQREVALKTLRSPADEVARARVWREARAAASVNHPAICQIYDVGEASAEMFIV